MKKGERVVQNQKELGKLMFILQALVLLQGSIRTLEGLCCLVNLVLERHKMIIDDVNKVALLQLSYMLFDLEKVHLIGVVIKLAEITSKHLGILDW